MNWGVINAVACAAFTLGWFSSLGLMFLFGILDLHWLDKWLESRAECRSLERELRATKKMMKSGIEDTYRK